MKGVPTWYPIPPVIVCTFTPLWTQLHWPYWYKTSLITTQCYCCYFPFILTCSFLPLSIVFKLRSIVTPPKHAPFVLRIVYDLHCICTINVLEPIWKFRTNCTENLSFHPFIDSKMSNGMWQNIHISISKHVALFINQESQAILICMSIGLFPGGCNQL